MKKIWLIILVALISVSCRTSEREERSFRNKAVIDSLMSELKEKDSALTEFIIAFSSIENILADIHLKQEALVANLDPASEELGEEISSRINGEINSLNALLEKNRTEIRTLNRQLATSRVINDHLDRLISKLNEQLLQKEEENAVLNNRILALNSQVRNLRSNMDTLRSITNTQSEKILEQSAWLQTAYYITGTKNELCDLNILEKAKVPTLCRNLHAEKFKRVEYQELSRLPLLCKKADLASYHPPGSYEIKADNKKNMSTLEILDPEKFWSHSKFLVIVTE